VALAGAFFDEQLDEMEELVMEEPKDLSEMVELMSVDEQMVELDSTKLGTVAEGQNDDDDSDSASSKE
jgi:hypothetical protein